MSANERQVGGKHYGKGFQHWDFVDAQNLDYFQGQITKYVCRWKDKNGVEDLEKAKHFLEKYIELESRKRNKSLAEITKEVVHGLKGRTPPSATLFGVEYSIEDKKLQEKYKAAYEKVFAGIPSPDDKINHPHPFGYDPNKEL
jgi:hypothetical protein